jgi:hypothetical protein
LKIHKKKMSGTSFPCLLRRFGSVTVSCSLLVFGALEANAASFSGDSTTILRARETGEDRDLYPLYEYLHLTGTDVQENGTTTLNFGGWGRGDLGDKSTGQNNNGDLQYGFLSYHGNRNNLQLRAGRQWVTEGAMSDRLDGITARGDFLAGFTGSAFIGTPATTDPNFSGGDLTFGGRVAQGMANYYSVGVSALKVNSGGDHLREEEAFDLWLHPLRQVDIAGRSSYNSISDGWMEHQYTASITPLEMLRVSLALQQVNYRQYFASATTSALRFTNGGLVNPDDAVLTLGGTVGVTLLKNVQLEGDFKNYNYEIAGDAKYYGGKVSYGIPDNFNSGFAFHRMDGRDATLQYNEYHAYVTKKLGRADVTLDFFDVDMKRAVENTKNTYAFTAAAGYDFGNSVRVDADIDYGKTSDLDDEVRGLVKVTWVFDSERGTK